MVGFVKLGGFAAFPLAIATPGKPIEEKIDFLIEGRRSPLIPGDHGSSATGVARSTGALEGATGATGFGGP